ncbi:MAG: ATP-binding protein [Lachnospiraceae bacterium]|nr:ATP-binding protein [Lachnospiraceae bacterium]
MFRLLPIQILLAAVGAVNGLVSSYFANNYVGVETMSAVGLYSTINMLITALSTMLIAGSAILCGKYLGQNAREKLQNVFSVTLFAAVTIGGIFSLFFILAGVFDLTGFFTKDPVVRPLFNRYLLGQSVGVIPLMVGNQLPAFLAMENRGKRTLAATLSYIAVNILLNILFVKTLHMEAFGLALATGIGLWVFLLIQLSYFLRGKSHLKLFSGKLRLKEGLEIVRVGCVGALADGYKTLRFLTVNWLLQAYIGTVGVSAYATADSLLRLFWAIPAGMVTVSRLLIGVSVGEEDRQTLTDVMRTMLKRFVPLMAAVALLLILGAEPLTRIFYRDPAQPVYMMTVWGLRLIPLCMPLSVICNHFVCYGQASGKTGLVQTLSLQDGVLGVAAFSALLIGVLGIRGVYLSSLCNGIVTMLIIIGYAWLKNRKRPRKLEDLMVIPASFGASEDERIDVSVKDIGEVVSVAEQVQRFCTERGIDEKRSLLAGLCMEEMAGNIVQHGFTKDEKDHGIDIRVVHKEDRVILRLKDDCVPFDPMERQGLEDPEDVMKNIGIRMVLKTAEDVSYQNILGLNVLTMKF